MFLATQFRETGRYANHLFEVSAESMFSIAGLFFSHPYHVLAMHVSEAKLMLEPCARSAATAVTSA